MEYRNLQQNNSENDKEIPKKRYVFRKKTIYYC